jgi:ankyrin repeat protein
VLDEFQDDEGWSPLILAAARGYLKLAKLLIEKGALVNEIVITSACLSFLLYFLLIYILFL